MIPSAPAPTRAAHAAYLTAHHPTPPILDEHFPPYETALANLQEEPTPFKLPVFEGSPFQTDDMEEEETGTSAAATTTEGADAAPPHPTAEGETPLQPAATATNIAPPGVPAPTTTQEDTDRRSALAAFLRAPSLREPTNLHMGDSAFLLHLLLDSPGTLGAISRISPPIPTPEAEAIWEAWSSHLAHDGIPAPDGTTARAFTVGVLTSSPTNTGVQAEAMTLLRLYVRDTVRTATLQAHTVGATQEEDMQQTSSKRMREDAGDTEDTGASTRRAQPGVTATEGHPTPPDLPPVTPPPRSPKHVLPNSSGRRHASPSWRPRCSRLRTR